jgi:hypothetical protein
MRRVGFYLVTIGLSVCVIEAISSASAQSAGSVFVTKMPDGYRDWKLISVAHEEANLNSFGAVLGNDVAVRAYRDGTLPFPDGTIIAALHYRFVPSDENNKAFGQAQSFVAGDPTNVQFMVKDSKKYAFDRRVGIRSLRPGRYTWRRRVAQDLRPLPREGCSRFCLHPLLALTGWLRARRRILRYCTYRCSPAQPGSRCRRRTQQAGPGASTSAGNSCHS